KAYSGKSKAIRKYLKPKLGLTKNQRLFQLNNKNGYVRSQSFDEEGVDAKHIINIYAKSCDFLIFTAKPHERGLNLTDIGHMLSESGFNVLTIEITKNLRDSYYEKIANEIHAYLKN